MQELEQLNTAMEQLKKEVWYLAKVTIPSLNHQGGDSSTEINSLKTQVNANTLELAEVNNKITSLNQITEELRARDDFTNTTISTLEANLNSQIEELRSQIGGSSSGSSGEIVDVIYDMNSEDAAINRGFTSGMVGGNQFSEDLSIYKRLIVYGVLNKNDAVAISYFHARKYTDITLHNASIGLNNFWFLKVTIPATKNKLVVNFAGYYDTDTKTGEMTFSREKGNALYYISRVEGIR